MENLNFEKLLGSHVYFIGIGGISMSGIAEILLERGYIVSGSDMKNSDIIERLIKKGADIHIGHDASNIDKVDLVVYTAAISVDNPELVAAKKASIPCLDRAEFLGRLMKTYPFALGVSGTHGKTTTTSMLSVIMKEGGLDPTVLVGGQVDGIGGNVRVGKSEYFLTEACEYVESFLKFSPRIAFILNIDEEHLDYFRDIEHIYSAFLKYANLVPEGGFVIGSEDDPLVSRLMKEVDRAFISFGIDKKADWMAKDISFDIDGRATFTPSYRDKDFAPIKLRLPGRHNVYNALAAMAGAYALGVNMNIISKALSMQNGAHRRFEIKKVIDNITIIDDYAHHPNEIRATLDTLKNIPHQRTFCVFQPHTYTRTKKLFPKFIDELLDVDGVIITDIYAAREKDPGDIHSRDLVRALNQRGQKAKYISEFDNIVDYLLKKLSPGDVLITMGAGDVYKIGDKLIESLTKLTPKAL